MQSYFIQMPYGYFTDTEITEGLFRSHWNAPTEYG